MLYSAAEIEDKSKSSLHTYVTIKNWRKGPLRKGTIVTRGLDSHDARYLKSFSAEVENTLRSGEYGLARLLTGVFR